MNKQTTEQLSNIRHTLAHLLASAVLELYPDTKNTIGPAVDDGFYYDFEFPADVKISDKDLPALEKKMKGHLKSWTKFTHKEVTEAEAKEHFKNNPYKLELIDEIIKKGEKITLYTCGNFTDL
jgi:threonyl-tRNA synthetase